MSDMTELWEAQIKWNEAQGSNWDKQIEIDENLIRGIRQINRLLSFLAGSVIALAIVIALRVWA